MDNKGSIFTSVVKKRQKSSKFNLSHDVKMSLNMGLCVPIMVMDVLPGDSVKINTSSLLRMAPMISPVMHKIDVFTEYFFVPNRILWANWETYITGSRNGKQLGIDEMPLFPMVPPFDPTKFQNGPGTLADYMGLPSDSDFPPTAPPQDNHWVSALPFAAYQRIWDEYYRDENLIESMYEVINQGDNPEALNNYNQLLDGFQEEEVCQQLSAIRPRAWEHDYFTSALPWAQKGEVVQIPIDTSGLGLEFDREGYTFLRTRDTAPPPYNTFDPWGPVITGTVDGDTGNYLQGTTNDGASVGAGLVDNTQNLKITNTGEGGGTTINDLRAAIKLQEWLETNARGGSRYFESIYAHFGVKSPDARLQRPEFIGSNRGSMVISEVLQTASAQSETDTPLGEMGGHGASVGSSRNFRYYAQEHGYIIGIMSVMPKTAYQQGIPKHFLKVNDRLQFYFPEFAHLGEQEIDLLELWAGDPEGAPLNFGYIPRYSEYKFINSRVAGEFRTSLNFWHMGRIFETGPRLNGGFVSSDPTSRIFAVEDGDVHKIYAHIFHDIVAKRLMPKYGTPSI